jgi:glycosyltransferase involved in cell wall biosynthesis
MRIIYLHQYFNLPKEAGSTRSYEMARRLVAAGHEVVMITTDRGSARASWTVEINEGIEVHRLGVPYSNYMGKIERISAFLRFAWKSAMRASLVSGDVVLATSTPLTIAIPGIYAARRLKVPMVLEVRDLWPDLPIELGVLRDPISIYIARLLERFAYKEAREIVALSPTMGESIASRGVSSDRITVIPNSADVTEFAKCEQSGRELRESTRWLGNRPMILYAGTLGRINGVAYLVKLAAALKAYIPDIAVVIVGDGAERKAVEDLARELGVFEESVYLLPPVPKEEIIAWFGAATIVTSLFVDIKGMWANSANKFFDGLAAGRPVAINYGGWQAKIIMDHDAGLILPPNDVMEAARMVGEKLSNEQWRMQAGQNAKNLAKQTFARDSLAKQLIEVLHRVVPASAGKERK